MFAVYSPNLDLVNLKKISNLIKPDPFFLYLRVSVTTATPNFTSILLYKHSYVYNFFLLLTRDWQTNYQGTCLSDNLQCKSIISYQSLLSNAFNKAKIFVKGYQFQSPLH